MEIQQMLIKELTHRLIAVCLWTHHCNQILLQGELNIFGTIGEVKCRDLRGKEKEGITCHWKIPTYTYKQTWQLNHRSPMLEIRRLTTVV